MSMSDSRTQRPAAGISSLINPWHCPLRDTGVPTFRVIAATRSDFARSVSRSGAQIGLRSYATAGLRRQSTTALSHSLASRFFAKTNPER